MRQFYYIGPQQDVVFSNFMPRDCSAKISVYGPNFVFKLTKPYQSSSKHRFMPIIIFSYFKKFEASILEQKRWVHDKRPKESQKEV